MGNINWKDGCMKKHREAYTRTRCAMPTDANMWQTFKVQQYHAQTLG